MTEQKVHKCPECGAECRCERGNFNPKDCVHYECFTGIAEPEVTNPVLEQKELRPLSPEETVQRVQHVLTLLESITDSNGEMSFESPLPKARVYLRGIIGHGIASSRPEDERVKETQQDAVKLIAQLEGIEDLLSRGPWEASQPDPFPYKVTIGNYTFDCPIGSSQIRADESNIPSGCLIPSGIIHHDDAEGIAELRNLVPHLIKTLSSLCPVQPAQDSTYEALRTISLGKHYPSCPIAQKTGKSYDDCNCMIGVAYKAIVAAVQPARFQSRVLPWLLECFGEVIANDHQERNHRFLEESLELVQACGASRSEAHQLVDYVYDRPPGKKEQETGGVMVTLAALCLAQGLDMHDAGEVELKRIWTKVDEIRAKQAAKPRNSPLPLQPAASTPTDSTIEKIMNQQPLDPKIAKALNEDFGELYEGTPTTPPDFTEREEELAREQIVQAITDIQEARLSHLHWAEYFEAHPEAEKQYESTGEWDNAKVHREWVEKYDNVLAILARFPFAYLTPATPQRQPKRDYTKHPEAWLRERGRQ